MNRTVDCIRCNRFTVVVSDAETQLAVYRTVAALGRWPIGRRRDRGGDRYATRSSAV